MLFCGSRSEWGDLCVESAIPFVRCRDADCGLRCRYELDDAEIVTLLNKSKGQLQSSNNGEDKSLDALVSVDRTIRCGKCNCKVNQAHPKAGSSTLRLPQSAESATRCCMGTSYSRRFLESCISLVFDFLHLFERAVILWRCLTSQRRREWQNG